MPVDYKKAAVRAIKHIAKFGDTDIFPSLPEMKCYVDNADEVADLFASLTVGNYRPSNCVEALTPKSWLGFRISHQLSAPDNIVYLASVISAAPELEKIRNDPEDGSAFAYRFTEGDSARIFTKGRSFHDWINFLTKF